MLEKLLLATILTFSFSLFANMGWSNTRKEMAQTPLASNHKVFTLTERYKNTEMDSNR
ncbi:hypothetical protein H6G06_16180 [Anabaena sphaerica FACHB-251]|uniref:Uncharacterized protein n=1 Tax=Anabaena sphaerica FACHB-251 TaxID=2692883 RepID=A0A926WJ04_9NOST|nr:hypothetical protein [Anabaena sphaerica]MBD2294977.1 hypothetical protein [Anabaena sphaerica FACHB-251]